MGTLLVPTGRKDVFIAKIVIIGTKRSDTTKTDWETINLE